MSKVKKYFKYFTLFDYDKEEKWLREMSNKGWKLRNYTFIYTFDKCEPSDTVYKLDFQAIDCDKESYVSLFRDYGWEYVCEYNNYVYFRTEAKKYVNNNEKNDIFSDNQSKLDMMKKIVKFKLIPLLLCFIGIFPNLMLKLGGATIYFRICVIILFVLYIIIFSRCIIGYRRNKKVLMGEDYE